MKYWNSRMECMNREDLQEIQLEKLQNTVRKVYQNVASYRKKMQAAGISPEDIRSLDDLQYLPFTEKTDLRDNYPYGMFAAPMSEIVRIHASSGTTGKPTVVGYTQKDISVWSEIVARSLVMAGGSKKSIVQVAYGYGLFTGGLGLHYGAEKLGGSVIPMSGGNSKKQIMIMRDFGSTILACTPSYALSLAETMEEMGVCKDEIKLETGIFGAEPWTEGMRREIDERLGIRSHDIYGLSEITGPGVSCDCAARLGMHIQEDYFMPEIVDKDTLKPLGYGQKGELVFTTLDKEGIPLIRYRTKDITVLEGDVCDCGRTFARMHKIMGRSDDMLIIRGVNVFPSQIEEILINIKGIEPLYHIVVDRVGTTDTLEILLELSSEVALDTVRAVEELQHKIYSELLSVLGLKAKITFVEPRTLERSEGKAKRVTDKRNLQ